MTKSIIKEIIQAPCNDNSFNSKIATKLREKLEITAIKDAYRSIHPDLINYPGIRYPSKPGTNNNGTRMDILFASENLIQENSKVNLVPHPKLLSDHLGISLALSDTATTYSPETESLRYGRKFSEILTFQDINSGDNIYFQGKYFV